jgi:hypothetical protein
MVPKSQKILCVIVNNLEPHLKIDCIKYLQHTAAKGSANLLLKQMAAATNM